MVQFPCHLLVQFPCQLLVQFPCQLLVQFPCQVSPNPRGSFGPIPVPCFERNLAVRAGHVGPRGSGCCGPNIWHSRQNGLKTKGSGNFVESEATQIVRDFATKISKNLHGKSDPRGVQFPAKLGTALAEKLAAESMKNLARLWRKHWRQNPWTIKGWARL